MPDPPPSKRSLDRAVLIAFFEIFYRKEAKFAILGQNVAYLGQNTRYFDFPVEISVISEISIGKNYYFANADILVILDFSYDL